MVGNNNSLDGATIINAASLSQEVERKIYCCMRAVLWGCKASSNKAGSCPENIRCFFEKRPLLLRKLSHRSQSNSFTQMSTSLFPSLFLLRAKHFIKCILGLKFLPLSRVTECTLTANIFAFLIFFRTGQSHEEKRSKQTSLALKSSQRTEEERGKTCAPLSLSLSLSSCTR